MDILTSLLGGGGNQYDSDLKSQKRAGYGTPSAGSSQSMYLSGAREQDRQAGFASSASAIGNLVAMIAFLNAQRNQTKKLGKPLYSNPTPYDMENDPAVNSGQQNGAMMLSPDILQMMRYMKHGAPGMGGNY